MYAYRHFCYFVLLVLWVVRCVWWVTIETTDQRMCATSCLKGYQKSHITSSRSLHANLHTDDQNIPFDLKLESESQLDHLNKLTKLIRKTMAKWSLKGIFKTVIAYLHPSVLIKTNQKRSSSLRLSSSPT